MNRRWFAVMLALAACGSVFGAGPCSSQRFEVHGIVTDPAGQPVPRARIYILLDEVSEKKFLEQGFRAAPFQAGVDGRFVAAVDCEEFRSGDKRDQPNPCAKKPRHVTVVVGQAGYKTRARIHRMKDLVLVESQGACIVALPEIRLVPGS
jgi:hypothetical protein